MVAARTQLPLVGLLLVLALGGASARAPIALTSLAGPSANQDTCSTCKLAVRVVNDMMCDPVLDDTLVDWVTTSLCPHFSDKASCADNVRTFAPLVVEWVRANADPDVLCASAGVCGAASYADVAKTVRARRSSGRSNDMVCPLCMFVVGQVKAQLSDPATRDAIRQQSLAACGLLPAGPMQDACTQWVDQNEAALFAYIDHLEPVEVCHVAGTCTDTALAAAGPAQPLSPATVVALGRLSSLLAAGAPALRTASRAGFGRAAAGIAAVPGNDNCEVCKVIIMEMHSVVANPDVQQQVIGYAKQACALVTSLTDQCVKDVDQYAPMVFGMVLAYLQPESVCAQLHLCPPPSLAGRAAAGVQLQAELLAAKYVRPQL